MAIANTGARGTGFGTGTELFVKRPVGAAVGDLLLAFCYVGSNSATLTPAAGWTLVGKAEQVNGGKFDLYCYRKFYESGDAEVVTFTTSASVGIACAVVSYSGVSATGPVDTSAAAATATATSTKTPQVSLTTANNAELLVWCATNESGTAVTDPEPGWTERAKETEAVQVADKAQATAGATGNIEGTVATAKWSAAMVVALVPALAAAVIPVTPAACSSGSAAAVKAKTVVPFTAAAGASASAATVQVPGAIPKLPVQAAASLSASSGSVVVPGNITFDGATEAAYAARTGMTLAVPAGAHIGDLLVLVVWLEATAVTINTPAGWQLIEGPTEDGYQLAVYWHRYEGEANVAVTWEGSHGSTGILLAYDGANTTTPIGARSHEGSAAETTSIKAPSITTSGPSRMLLFLGVNNHGNTITTAPAGYTARTGIGTVYSADKLQAAAGASGEVTAKLESIGWTLGLLLALTPEGLSEPPEPVEPPVIETTGEFGTNSIGEARMPLAAEQELLNEYAAPSGELRALNVYLEEGPSMPGDGFPLTFPSMFNEPLSQVVRGVVYAADGAEGGPGSLLGVSNPLEMHGTPGEPFAAGWYPLSFPTAISLAGGNYYIGLLVGAEPGVIALRYRGGGQLFTHDRRYALGALSPAGSGWLAQDNQQLSLYATLTAEGGVAPVIVAAQRAAAASGAQAVLQTGGAGGLVVPLPAVAVSNTTGALVVPPEGEEPPVIEQAAYIPVLPAAGSAGASMQLRSTPAITPQPASAVSNGISELVVPGAPRTINTFPAAAASSALVVVTGKSPVLVVKATSNSGAATHVQIGVPAPPVEPGEVTVPAWGELPEQPLVPTLTYPAWDLLTLEPLGVLPYTSVTFGRQVNQPGPWSGTLAVTDMSIQKLDYNRASSPGKTLLCVDFGGQLVWSGMIWTRHYQDSERRYVVGAMELTSYFRQRLQAADYGQTWENGVNPLAAAQQVVEEALQRGSIAGGMTLVLQEAEPAPSVKLSYPGASPQTVDSILNTLSQMGYKAGLDYDITAQYLPATRTPALTMTFYFPRQGRPFSQSGIVLMSRDTIDWTYPEDATQIANEVWDTGSGSQGLQPFVASVALPDYPLYQRLMSRAQLNTEQALANTAAGDLGLYCYPQVTPAITLPLPGPLQLGDFQLGDDFQFRVDPTVEATPLEGGENASPRFPSGSTFEWRMVGWHATVADRGQSTLLIDAAVPPLETIPPPEPPTGDDST